MKQKNNCNSSICLNMIVKDESHVIEKTLNNLCNYIDFSYWVISDTGSTDNTKELIINFFKNKNIPGELVEHTWKDFSHNRNKALECAYNKTDYVLIFDADDKINGDFMLPKELTLDGYNLKFGNEICVYERTLLVNNRIKWEYVGVLHEVIVCRESNFHIALLEGNYYLDSGRSGARNNDPNKYIKDAKVLENAHKEAVENDDELQIRYSFYCAQSYKDCGEAEKAIEWYKKRIDYGGWWQELYYSHYMIGELYNGIGETEKAVYHWIRTLEYDNERLEGIYHVIHHFYEQQQWNLALHYYKYVEPYMSRNKNLHKKLFTWKEVYEYKMDFDVVIIAFNTKQWKMGFDSFNRLFKQRSYAPPEITGNIIFNFQFFLDHIKQWINEEFFNNFLGFINCHKIFHNYTITEKDYTIINDFINQMREKLIASQDHIKNKLIKTTINCFSLPLKETVEINNIEVLLTFTTCKRLDLFIKTVNSFMKNCSDIGRIGYFYCVDDNSSFEDREKMRTMYPFINFYFKSLEEKGHRPSMNIIWDKLNELKPKYWLHMEDDWLFLKQDDYISKSIAILEQHEEKNIHQVLFNRNYGETFESYNIVGGERFVNTQYPKQPLLLHVKDQPGLKGPNSSYWPHYSFRPSVSRTSIILELGNFDSENNFFERDYADKYFEKGYKSAFFDEITCLHTGKLTTENNDQKQNAYALNDMEQFNTNILDKSKQNNVITSKKEKKLIAFHCSQLCERGDAVALFDYAYYNRKILKNDSIIIYKTSVNNKNSVIRKFNREFITVKYNEEHELENIVKQFNIDLFYTIGWGTKTDAFNCVPCPVLTHAIFSNSPFTREGWETKDRYAVISKYLTTKHSCSKNYIPHMINMPNANDNKIAYREKYNIPSDAFVLGRYGGTDSFDIGYVHEAIKQVLSEKNNIYFLFANTDKFYEHERIIYAPQLIDMDEKASFIQCCDAMIHGRTVGETFGISIGEFSFYNKPIITNYSVPIANLLSDNCHVEILGDKGFIYHSKEEVYNIITTLSHEGIDTSKNWNAYDDYTPKKVMEHFDSCFIQDMACNKKETVNNQQYTTWIVNLERRIDRRIKIDKILVKDNVHKHNVKYFKAVDGKQLETTQELTKLFKNNDFGWRRGVIGCALSHYELWKKLSQDKGQDFYIILEDDFTVCSSFQDKFSRIVEKIRKDFHKKIDILYLGYSMYDNDREKYSDIYNDNENTGNIGISPLNRELYVGGTFGYVITKSGANKMLDYIEKNGIKHGIDYLKKINTELRSYETRPQLVYADWNENNKDIDSDIQNSYESLEVDISNLKKSTMKYEFFEALDVRGNDITQIPGKSIEELKVLSEENPDCVAFNSFGYLKSDAIEKTTSPFMNPPHGLYVNVERLKEKINKKMLHENLASNLSSTSRIVRVKLLCNWCDSKQLCEEWKHMGKNIVEDGFMWNDIEFTWKDDKIDFYILINKPNKSDDFYIPERTIIFHMEPWCGMDYQSWGVKTWGDWAEPDESKFLQVRTHKHFINNAFWQLTTSYEEIKNKTPRKTKDFCLSTICSSKYEDPGQKKRIDFLKFIESKENIGFDLDIYNKDNNHGFSNYRGPVSPHVDKEKGIMPYKYYFMVENNFEHNFITEKIWEPILTETLCFYDGCPNILQYINADAFVQIDMNDFEKSYNIIREAIQQDWWSQRIDIIRKEKERVLEYFAFCPTVERVLFKDMAFENCIHPNEEQIIFNKYFCYKENNETEGTLFDSIKYVSKSTSCEEGTDKNITHNYLHIYEQYLRSYRHKENNILEIGVAGGHSIALWDIYFKHPNKQIYGVDIDLSRISANIKNKSHIHLFEMDGTNAETAKNINKKFDIIIDDASHFQHHQIATLDLFLPYLSLDGVYIIEDIDPKDNIHDKLLNIANKHSFTMEWHDLRDLSPVHRFDNIMAVFKKNK